MLLLNLIISKYSLFRMITYLGMAPLFPDMSSPCQILPNVGQFPGKHFLSLPCSGSTCSDCTGSSTPVVCGKVLVFYFPFCQFLTVISSSFF